MGQKTRPDVLKTFLMFIFTVPIILSDAEISTALGDFLKILTCGSKIFKNDPTFKMVKIIIFQHLMIFSFILGKLGQVVHICLILPPGNFYRPRKSPLKIGILAEKCTKFNLSNLVEISAADQKFLQKWKLQKLF